MTEEYINLVGNLMYPKTTFKYGYDITKNELPISRVTTLGFLLNPVRRPTIIEKWSPFEIAVFEATLALYGKQFHIVHKHVPTKTVKEIIEFYYDWKKTHHYKQWKKTAIMDPRDTPVTVDPKKSE
jgi:hypothetical protein